MPHRGVEPASAACRSDALPTGLHPQDFEERALGSSESSKREDFNFCVHGTHGSRRQVVCSVCLPERHQLTSSHSEELRTQKLKSHLVRTQSLNVLSLKPGVGHIYIQPYILRLLKGISSLLISTLPVHSPALCSKPLSRFFLCWLRLTHGSCVGPQNKIGHPAGGRFLCWVPAEYKQA